MSKKKHRKQGLGRSIKIVSHLLASRLLDWSVESSKGFSSPCWIWQGHLDKDGYPEIKFRGYKYRACRVSYTLFVNEIPDGDDIDHLCNVRSCVNPRHLESIDALTNRIQRRAERLPLRLDPPSQTFSHVSASSDEIPI